MNKALKIIAGILVGLLLLLLVTPYLFKDKIKNLVQSQAEEMLEAEVHFDDLSLSLLRHFPHATISIEEYAVVGKGLFEGDTLLQGRSFDLLLNFFELFWADAIQIKSVVLEQPTLRLIILEDGTANYDILKEDSTTAGEETAESGFLIRLQSYEAHHARVYYEDASLPMRMEIFGLEHQGSGDLSAITYELHTRSRAESVRLVYDGLTYLNKAVLDAQMDLHIEMEPFIKVTFLENTATLNALPLEVEGFVALPGEDIDMDLSITAKSADFQSLLSMVPGVYTADFNDIQTDGSMAFTAHFKGIYNEQRMPDFKLELQARDAWVQYPGLPNRITGIEVDLKASVPGNEPEQTAIDLNRLHADFGNNPIDAKLRIRGYERPSLDGQLKAQLKLEELTTLFPIEGTELRGGFSLDARINGLYDEAQQRFPSVQARMQLENGYTKQAEYPVELSNMNVLATLTNTDASMAHTVLEVARFHFELDGQPLDGSLYVENFDDPAYRLQANGRLDLEKLMKLYPIEGMQLRGKLLVQDFRTSGRMSDIEAERYSQLPTSGQLNIQQLYYADKEYPQGVRIAEADLSFTPERMEIARATGMLGSSDFQVQGYASNYLAYALMDDQPLKGEMSFTSQKLDLNEWMMEGASTEQSSGQLSVLPVPENLDVEVTARIDSLIYDQLTLQNLSGSLRVAQQEVRMQELGFGMLGANVSMNGAYNTQNLRKPTYEFFLDVKKLGFRDAYTHFVTVRAFAPVAQHVNGLFNTTLGIKGSLKANMMPYLEDISSVGLVEIVHGGLENVPVLEKMAQLTKIPDLSDLKLEEVAAQFEIQEGAMEVKPFTLTHKDLRMTIAGKQFITGKMDYDIELDVPSGRLGQAAIKAVSEATGSSLPNSERIRLSFKLGGTYKQPTISNLKSSATEQLKDELIQQANDKLESELGTKVPLDSAAVKETVDSLKQQVTDSLKTVVEEVKTQAKDSLNSVKEQVLDSLNKKIEEEVGQDVKNQLDSLKKVLNLPKFGKKKKQGGN